MLFFFLFPDAYVLKHKDCSYMRGEKPKLSGVYTIYLNDMLETQVYCDMITDGGGWTVCIINIFIYSE